MGLVKKKVVRVRFAPSPTGDIHIGNVRAALFNYMFAKKENGRLILRIEDTDEARNTEGSVEGIIDDLRWLGIEFDEGPGLGGDYGPYKQSERLDIYKSYAQKLLNEGRAVKDYSHLKENDKQIEGLDFSKDYAIRLKTNNEVVKFNDIVFGDINKEVEDFIIMKSTKVPTYHFAVVIDDYLMQISHVIRGQDHLGNTAKHVYIAKALGIKPPEYAHFSLTHGLSKRDKSKSIRFLKEKGYLPEAITNMAMLLGWAPKDGKEKFNINSIYNQFNLEDLTKVNSIFNEDKFNWLASSYLRETDIDKLKTLCYPYLLKAGYVTKEKQDTDYIKKVLYSVKDYLTSLSDINKHIHFFFKEPVYDNIVTDNINWEQAKVVLGKLNIKLQQENNSLLNDIKSKAILKDLGKETKIKGKALFMPIRLALTGEEHGPELYQILATLDPKQSIKRINTFLAFCD